MRYIQKNNTEPASFTRWKGKASADWEPTFENMNSAVKKDIKSALKKEQLGLCCYCESKLRDDYSHIEHFRPQETYKWLSLDYGNMLCSCQSNLKKGDPIHCGNAKDNWFDESLTISPLSRDCASHFRYTGDGHVYPADEHDSAAIATIEHLKLDIRKLVDSRQEVINAFLDPKISDAEFKRFYDLYFRNLSAENPPEFISAIIDVFK